MIAKFKTLLLVPLFASCTAINQQDAFLDSLPRPVDNVVFKDDFDNGLGKWIQTSGTWTTSTPAMSGLALQSPSSATAARLLRSQRRPTLALYFIDCQIFAYITIAHNVA